MIKIVALALLSAICFAADDATKLPVADQAAIDKCMTAPEADKAYEAYQLALMKAQDKALKELDKVKQDAMKRGNLALANAADAQAKKVRDGVIGDLIVAKKEQRGDLPGEGRIDLAKAIVGEWKGSVLKWNDIVTVDDKMNARFSSVTGKVVIANGVASIKWSNGFTWKGIRYDSSINGFIGSCFFPTDKLEGECRLSK